MTVAKESWKGLATEQTLAEATNLLLSSSLNVLQVDSNGEAIVTDVTPYRVTVSIDRPANTTNYEAGDAIGEVVASVKQKETVTLSGTSGTANIIGPGGLTKLATFVDDITQTVINFESAYVLDYAAVGIALTRDLDDLVFEAAVAGVPFTAPTVVNVTTDLTGTVGHTTANVTLENIILNDMAATVGGSGYLNAAFSETSVVEFAGKTITCWLFEDEPDGLVGDGVVFTNPITNWGRRAAGGFFTITYGALPAGGSSVIGRATPAVGYTCNPNSKNLYLMVTTPAVTAPTSAGVFKFAFEVTNRR